MPKKMTFKREDLEINGTGKAETLFSVKYPWISDEYQTLSDLVATGMRVVVFGGNSLYDGEVIRVTAGLGIREDRFRWISPIRDRDCCEYRLSGMDCESPLLESDGRAILIFASIRLRDVQNGSNNSGTARLTIVEERSAKMAHIKNLTEQADCSQVIKKASDFVENIFSIDKENSSPIQKDPFFSISSTLPSDRVNIAATRDFITIGHTISWVTAVTKAARAVNFWHK